jgi:predicted S18 family serine protease
VVLPADIELRPGQGRILIDTKPRIGIDLQSTLRTVVTMAENITGVSFNSTDVILTISYKEGVDVVDGLSAGATITIGLIAAMKNASISPDVYNRHCKPRRNLGQGGGDPREG